MHVYSVALEVVPALRPLIERVETRDTNLADQLQRGATSVLQHAHEGAYFEGENPRARFHTALGSAAAVKACLDVAAARGYIDSIDASLLKKLDQVVAALQRLARG